MAKKDNTKNNQTGLTRRDFLKASAATAAAGGFASALDWGVVGPSALATGGDTFTHSICPYCSVGCGLTIATDSTKTDASKMYGDDISDSPVVDIFGDKISTISNGALCSKGAAAIQLANNTRRVGTPKYRLGNGDWVDATWEEALASGVVGVIDSIPKLMADTKDATGANSVAFLGCSHATNEANWMYRKLIAQFGTNNTEHQARI